ncbi:MAG: hypothetical protein GY849_08910 [Deltaproteobacteria bacterium]|nr:hypothetical protein [Deltaproteobacteria bacterium]
MRMRKAWLWLVGALSFLYWAAPLFALDDELLSLQGLKGLYVVVEELNPEIEKDGLTPEHIQKDAAQRLRQAGMKVLTKIEWMKKKEGPYLYINLNARKNPYGVYMHAISIELVQKVLLMRNPKVEVFATTWSKQLLGQGGYLARIRYSIQDVVDLFLNAWAKANRK